LTLISNSQRDFYIGYELMRIDKRCSGNTLKITPDNILKRRRKSQMNGIRWSIGGRRWWFWNPSRPANAATALQRFVGPSLKPLKRHARIRTLSLIVITCGRICEGLVYARM